MLRRIFQVQDAFSYASVSVRRFAAPTTILKRMPLAQPLENKKRRVLR
jgi:hypothetical protein